MAKRLWQFGANDEIAQQSDLSSLSAYVVDESRYDLVTAQQTGDWQFSDGGTHTISVDEYDPGGQYPWAIVADGIATIDNVDRFQTKAEADAAFSSLTSCSFDVDGSQTITATRAYALQGHANNLIDATSGNVTLTLPEYENGKVRDLLIKVSVPSSVTSFTNILTWQGQGDEAPSQTNELKFMTEDGTFPTITEAGNYLFSLTEVEHHVFAISMKSLVNASQS